MNDPLNEAEARLRSRRKSCLLQMVIAWFSIMAILILIMFFVRSRVIRDAEAVAAYVDQFMTMELPEGFYPYSLNRFLGVTVVSFYDSKNVREDGRTTSVVSLYTEKGWQEMGLEAVRDMRLAQLEKKLDRVEFRAEDRSQVTVEGEGQAVIIYRFSGKQRLDDKLVEATSCFRFMNSPEGPLQLQSMGLDQSFDPAAQIKALASFQIKQTNP